MAQDASRSAASRPSGAAAAAIVGAAAGLLALAVTQVVTHASAAATKAVFALGKLWMPGAEGIGPYSGKETIALVVWLASWGILHAVWRRREVNLVVVGTIALVLIGIATTLIWAPVYTSWGH